MRLRASWWDEMMDVCTVVLVIFMVGYFFMMVEVSRNTFQRNTIMAIIEATAKA